MVVARSSLGVTLSSMGATRENNGGGPCCASPDGTRRRLRYPAEHSALHLPRSSGHVRLHAMPWQLARFSITRWKPSPAGHSVETVDRKSTQGPSSFQEYTRGRWHR